MGKHFSLKVTIEAAGPFLERTIIGIIKPGVNLLCGQNGTGKTTLMRILQAFGRLRTKIGDLEVNDQATGSTARVTFGGAEMTAILGRKPKLDGAESLPPIEALPDPISALETGDNRKGEGPAYRSRLAAILRWLGLDGDRKALLSLAGDDEALRKWAEATPTGVDLIEAADEARKVCHKERRLWEDDAKQCQKVQARMEGERDQAATAAEMEPDQLAKMVSEDGAGAKLVTATKLASAGRRDRARLEAEEERRADLNLDSKPHTKAAEDAVSDIDKSERILLLKRDHVSELEAKVATLADELAAAKIELTKTRVLVSAEMAQLDLLEQHLNDATQKENEIAALREELARPLVGPTEDEIEALQDDVEIAEQGVALAKAGERMRDILSKLQVATDETTNAEQKAAHYAAEAADVWIRLANTVNELLDSERIRLVGEKIEIFIEGKGGGWRDIADPVLVSEGQRADACYSLMLEQREGERVVVVEGATSVDPVRLARIGAMARERGVAIVMETPATEEEGITLQHYGTEE